MKLRPLGESTLLVEWPEKISEDILSEILHFEHELLALNIQGITDINHAYHSLAVSFNSGEISIEELKKVLTTLPTNAPKHSPHTEWEIPVCYDKSFAYDLDTFCEIKEMASSELISLHTSGLYTLYFIGFLPGFMYLGGLDERLHTPRKSNPDRSIPKGSVAIGGHQTGIYPTTSPGGWYVIGNCPLDFFGPQKDPPVFVQPGDKVRFSQVSIEKYQQIKADVEKGIYKPQSRTIHG